MGRIAICLFNGGSYLLLKLQFSDKAGSTEWVLPACGSVDYKAACGSRGSDPGMELFLTRKDTGWALGA